MVPAIIYGEKRHQLKRVFVAAIALMLLAQLGMALWLPDLGSIVLWLALYFVAFNILEATQPSPISKIAPADAKGNHDGRLQHLSVVEPVCRQRGGRSHLSALGRHAGIRAVRGSGRILLWLAAGMQAPRAVKTQLFHIGDNWLGAGRGTLR